MTILAPKKFTIRRQSEAGSYVYGKWVPSTTTDQFTVIGSLQPLNAREIEMLPEGTRTKARFSFYCESNQPFLKTTDLNGQKGSDRFLWNGNEYLVFAIGDWQLHLNGIPHKAYVLIEVGNDE